MEEEAKYTIKVWGSQDRFKGYLNSISDGGVSLSDDFSTAKKYTAGEAEKLVNTLNENPNRRFGYSFCEKEVHPSYR